MKRIVFVVWLFVITSAQAQGPKLVVGIVVDQMRQEYLYRFEKKFGPGGFKRLMNDGFMLKNAHYNYIPTFTGPGHASIYTGTTPAIHGIIGNDWYDRTTKTDVNCVGDDRQKPVGSEKGNGDVSPWRLISSTVTDELKISTQRRAKVIGFSMKDRGAVLPAGHLADGAYWFDGTTGKFISSTYYKPGLPLWLDKFNGQNLAEQYLNQDWNTLLAIDQYTESGPDDTNYETQLKGKEQRPTFPYPLKAMRAAYGNFELINTTPFGDDLLTDVAKASLDGEELGKDEVTDFLTISYSCPDIIGHAMGPQSVEVEDAYLRLDKNIEGLLKELDRHVGAGQYVVFLTADHGVAEVPQFLKDNKLNAGILRQTIMEAGITEYLKKYYPDKKMVERVINQQVFLSTDAFTGDPKTAGVDMLVVSDLIARYIMTLNGVAQVYNSASLKNGSFTEGGAKGAIIRGYNHKRSGDIVVLEEPGYIGWQGTVGTTHGSGYSYDTHVPVLFYGYGINKGSSLAYHPITDIAPTLSVLLKIKFPSGCTGQPAAEVLK